MKALIFEGKVVDIQEKEFEVHPSMTWVDATEDTEFHGTWDGTSFGPRDTRTEEQKLKTLGQNFAIFVICVFM